MNQAEALRRLREVHPALPDALLAVVDAAIGGHWHQHYHPLGEQSLEATGPPFIRPEHDQIVHTAQYPLRAVPVAPEPPEALTGVLRPDDAPEAPEGQGEARKRPGRTSPTPTADEVLTRIQALCAEAGVGGYAPLSIDGAVEGLITRGRAAQQVAERNAQELDRERERTAVAKAEARQWRESASHHRQIAEHYRDALAHLIAFAGGDDQSRAALANPPEWDGRLI